MPIIPYRRSLAVQYARRWALSRNPAYYNFDDLGGDCTNFASQCIYAGSGVMNYTPIYGWYYITANDRTASWTGVEYLYRFLVGNEGAGPFGRVTQLQNIRAGGHRASSPLTGRRLATARWWSLLGTRPTRTTSSSPPTPTMRSTDP